jgi:hypothetical protein
MSRRTLQAPGPFRADQIPEGSPYELSDGHPVFCLPTGRRGGKSNLTGGGVLETDPAVKAAGVDVGFSKDPSHLRAPDVAVGDFPDEPGWAEGAPPLAVEYADVGQDERELQKKIAELLEGGTKHLWVVRLAGVRRVEVYEPRKRMRVALPGDELVAPGILKNPVPVLALYDREAAHEATLRNLLQRRGYENLDAVREEGRSEGEISGRREALLQILNARKLAVSDQQSKLILAERDLSVLDHWIARATSATTTALALGEKGVRRSKPRRR